ncbi:hypothetical protein [Salipiger marinus]|uniref:Uncharacterized protein n=1 Tax=Salipiger marinus TaxID=555512 RepID=A0A1G8LYH6_9RHOB|nr:hypothetical protein [Salipiger marinus]SDI60557.1 hypothetical protein SAMN04487993_100763 [Salipiger marinus]
MTPTPSRAVALYGTEEQVPPPRLLTAGPLSAELEAGNLRDIRFAGAEVLRAVSYIVRDKDWGTYSPTLDALEVQQEPDRFVVTYRARVAEPGQAFAYEARIEGRADGTLTFTGSGAAETPFLTNRTGFVILHPIAGVAGGPVTLTHVDGRQVEGRFPDLIDPVQPMMDLRALEHVSPEGHRVHCLMEGDTFEMEDQRNWTDASYKTYVRPLALPWPYELEPGARLEQKITLRITGAAGAATRAEGVTLDLGREAGRMPALGMGLDPGDAAAALTCADPLRALGPAHLLCHHDPRRGHDRASLQAQLDVAQALGAEPWLEAVIAATDDAGAEAEVTALGATVAGLGAPFATVLLSPAPDLKCTLPGSVWPEAPDAAALAQVARQAFPGARLGGGMFSYFTELNRKRPPVDALDLVSFTTSAMVHAGDDRSVMESLEALPAIARSAAEIARPLPFAVGPSAMGMRANPYGAAPKDNPDNIRQAMNFNDPRQRGLLGAAWTLGALAQFATGGAEAVALGAPVGAFGAVHVPTRFPQPWYDDHGGLYPLFHPLRGLARLRGQPLRRVDSSDPARVLGLAVGTPGETEIWLANLTADPVRLHLPQGARQMACLSAAEFAEAAEDPGFLDRLAPVPDAGISLDAYSVLRLLGAF